MARTIEEAEKIISLYEQNGAAKLYYALNRKMNEIGELFNKNSLININLDDPKDKSFDRLFKLLEKSEVVSKAAEAAKSFAGIITGNEEKDVQRKATTPETMAQELGDYKTQNV